jgi:hypothetical protein
MPVRGPLVRLLRWTGALGAGVLAVVGGLGLRGPGLVAVGVAALVVGCTAVGIVRDSPGPDRRAVIEAGVQASAWTVGLLLVIAGAAALAGGLVALLVATVAALTWLGTRVARARRGTASAARSTPVEVLRRPDAEGAAASGRRVGASPVPLLPTPALGREWIRTTAALAGRLTPSDREALVRRREEVLDELERRDQEGFARWLADGPAPGSDPAAYVRPRPVHGDPTAGTDAA